MSAVDVIHRLGNPADCEAVSGGYFAQGVNAWSSLGYGAVGILLAVAATRGRFPRVFLLLALTAVVEAVGSVLYHGRPGDAAQLVHDLGLVAMVGFIAGWHAGRLRGAANGGAAVGTVALVAVAVALAVAGVDGATNVFAGVSVAVIVACELLARRRRLAPVWRPGLLFLLALALLSWLAGSADSPLCEPSSPLQAHGLWHLLSALVVLIWADAATRAETGGLGYTRRVADRLIGLAARLVGHTFFRSIETINRDRLPEDRPVLLLANHGNGFVDPIVLAAALGRFPRFIAKAALWKVVPARFLLDGVGALPVYRHADGDRTANNESVFDACHRALADGGTVAIFPEGTTGNRASLDRIKSGAARIAIGALPTAPDLAVVPVGLAYENRAATRPRAVLVVGDDVPLADLPAEEHAAVAVLNGRFTEALSAISPEFESLEQRQLFRAAAAVAASEHHVLRAPPFSEVEFEARRIAAAEPAPRAAVDAAFREYATQLQLAGLSDRHFGPAGITWPQTIIAAVLAVLFGSVVVTATLIHLPALILILAATASVRSTATKGTVRLLVGLAAGVLTWVIAGIIIGDGWGAVLAGVVVAVEGQLALLMWPVFASLVSRGWGSIRRRDRGDLVRPVLAAREALVRAIDDATPVEAASVEGEGDRD